MQSDLRAQIERVGEHYDLQGMLQVRAKTRAAIGEIAAAITPGMTEDDAVEHARKVLSQAQMVRGWHGIKIRFGSNTLKSFSEPSDPGVRLSNDDIFFIDIGPVWQGWEGDGGETFVAGNDPQMKRAAREVRVVFDRVRSRWLADRLCGRNLYEYAAAQAADLGWQLNLDMNGHRLSDFPHAALHKGPLSEVPFVPAPNLWVLEIQIRHPERAFGAFFEDLLLQE